MAHIQENMSTRTFLYSMWAWLTVFLILCVLQLSMNLRATTKDFNLCMKELSVGGKNESKITRNIGTAPRTRVR